MSTTENIPSDEVAADAPAGNAGDADTRAHEDEEGEYQFTPKLSPAWALNLEQVAAVAFFGALFIALNSMRLQVSDIWGHVLYGKWIIAEGAIPAADPFMPLAAGMKVIDTAWLSQVIFGAVDRWFGEEALSHLFAFVNLAAYLVLARLFYLQTRRVWLSVACTGLLIFVGWSRVATIRPENFAVLCFAVVVLLAARLHGFAGQPLELNGSARKFDYWTWIALPVTFALWANLHGSFVVGLAVLGCFLLGRVMEVAWQSRDFRTVLSDKSARRWLYVLEISAAATLLNPYGLDLWLQTLSFSANENMATILEWEPLYVTGIGGRSFFVSVVLLLFVWRQSRRPIRPAEVLLILMCGFAALGSIRMLGWYAPVFVMVVAPHIAEIVGRWFPAWGPLPEPVADADSLESPATSTEEDEGDEQYELPPGQSFRYSLVALLLIWIAFALSPSSQLIFNKQRGNDLLLSENTPFELTEYLKTAYSDAAADPLPGGQTFHPQLWGDWLTYDGPADFQPFATTNMHLVPPRVWKDYLNIMALQDGWQNALNRYNVTTVIVDRKSNPAMYGMFNRSDNWQRKYEDELSAVFVRSAAAPAASRRADAVDDSPPPANADAALGDAA